MFRHSTILTIISAILLFCTGTAAAQDEKKNTVSLTILPIGARTLSMSYARRFKNGNEIIFNPRFQVASDNVATEPATDKGSNKRLLFGLDPDPQRYYNHYMFRTGVRLRLGESLFGFEPTVQLAYGAFLNKVLKTDDPSGNAYDTYLRLDRKYYSAGLIGMFSWIKDFEEGVRLKFFLGVGAHVREYRETQWASYVWYRERSFPEPQKESYSKTRYTFHGGLEIGFRY